MTEEGERTIEGSRVGFDAEQAQSDGSGEGKSPSWTHRRAYIEQALYLFAGGTADCIGTGTGINARRAKLSRQQVLLHISRTKN